MKKWSLKSRIMFGFLLQTERRSLLEYRSSWLLHVKLDVASGTSYHRLTCIDLWRRGHSARTHTLHAWCNVVACELRTELLANPKGLGDGYRP